MTTEALHPALSPEHLTDVLRRAGALTDGRVSRVVVESSRDKFLSQITRARLAYEGGAHGAPEGLHLLLEDLTDSHQVVADWRCWLAIARIAISRSSTATRTSGTFSILATPAAQTCDSSTGVPGASIPARTISPT